MSYSDQKFYSRASRMVADGDAATGTLTASGSNALTTSFPMPTFKRRTAVTDVRVIVNTAPATNVTVTTLNFLNGTNTFATVVVSTNAANAEVIGTVTASNGTFTASGTPTVTVVATGTASAQSYGKYEVFFETNELYS